eukprot:CAMPEP_0174274208 /NCGR_PEP_ID=MMETSP0439-20130205/57228_1 /TAXON_ID=0 /ORGANISM="Stereomyxa ramosa, Strain Chinc5" /LENGTH=36 /DNA_ID= /DNA_START= /DNA_END= /DNA_ORIENTATION=
MDCHNSKGVSTDEKGSRNDQRNSSDRSIVGGDNVVY